MSRENTYIYTDPVSRTYGNARGTLAADFAATPPALCPVSCVLFRSIFHPLGWQTNNSSQGHGLVSRSSELLAWKFNTFGFKSQDMLLAPRCQALAPAPARALRDWLPVGRLGGLGGGIAVDPGTNKLRLTRCYFT